MSDFDPFTIGTIVVLVIVIGTPLGFFIFASRRLCCDKQLRHLFDQQLDEFGDEGEGVESQIKDPPKVLLSFRNVKYAVPIGGGEEKVILKGVNAYFAPGTLTAVMGPSGCGKSTLLDILADQKEYGIISGDIRINGSFRTGLFRRASAYVLQFDVLYPQLTPRETLYFVTALRLGEHVPQSEKYHRIQQTLKELDLSHVADTRIGEGDGGGGLSGGQKRRVTVAIELVTGPGLILLDEPTSGLDAFGSLKLVEVLRKLADNGRTIACTIHQPRADIFKLFDKLLLMKLGVTMYFGPIDGIFPYFENLGIQVDYSVNPADFIVDLTQDKSEEDVEEEKKLIERIKIQQEMEMEKKRDAEEQEDRIDNTNKNFVDNTNQDIADNTSKGDDEKKKDEEEEETRGEPAQSITAEPVHVDLDSLCDSYAKSKIKRQNDKNLRAMKDGTWEDMPPTLEQIYKDDDRSDDKYATPFLQQVFTLSCRSIVNDMRNSAYIAGNWVIGPIMMLFYGALYSNIETPQNVNQVELDQGLVALNACSLNNTDLEVYGPQFSVDSLASCGNTILDQQNLAFARASLIYQFMAAAYFSEGPFVAQVFLDKRMFFREHAARSYSSGAYHYAWYIRLFFAATVKGALFTPIGYFAAQLVVAAEPYFLFSIFFGAMSAAGSSMALLCASIFPTLETAQAVFVLVNVLAQTLSGYWVVEAYIPPWFIWLFYMNFFRYAFEGAILGQQVLQKPEFRDNAWFYSLLVIFFGLIFQLIAFIATWLTHRVSTTDASMMATEEEEEEEEEEEMDEQDLEARESTLTGTGSDRKQKLRGVSRRNVFDRYREAQMASSRQIPQQGNFNKNKLANNGGILYY